MNIEELRELITKTAVEAVEAAVAVQAKLPSQKEMDFHEGGGDQKWDFKSLCEFIYANNTGRIF